jgi:hypothetical protein
LNPHLAVSGFPCFFDTEGIDTHLNSALTGVSSFGFGGTNGRCDVWGACKAGKNKAEFSTAMLDQLMVTCPITMGHIDHMSGEPVKRPTGDRKRYRADVLRDEFAPYDISTHAYTGGFRWRLDDLAEDEDGEDLEDGLAPYIRGSWSGWTEFEEMESQGNGEYTATIVLGESRCELFDICLNKDTRLAIYPAVHKATPKIWINGPDGNSEGKKWIIDGRDMEVPAGTVYQVTFKWSTERMQLSWSEADKGLADAALAFEHTYFVAGSFSKWKCVALTAGGDDGSCWEGSFSIGSQGWEDFVLVRDKDMQQAIYPAKHKGLKEETSVRGPDDLGGQKYFRVFGRLGEETQVKLTIVDAKVVVSVENGSHGGTEWKSVEGWDRHSYSVLGSVHGGEPVPMSMDVLNPGTFKCRITMGEDYDANFDGFVEYFQVCVDDGTEIALYPEMNLAGSGETIVRGPDSKGGDRSFLVRCPVPYASLDVTLDLTAEDRRKMVTWSWVSAQESLAE